MSANLSLKRARDAGDEDGPGEDASKKAKLDTSGNLEQALAFPMDLVDRLGSAFVTLIAGDEKEAIQVDRALLCANVPYFEGAFRGNFKEAKSSSVAIPEQSPRNVKVFVMWLYSGCNENGLPREAKSNLPCIVSLFAAGEKWLIPSLQRACFRELKERIYRVDDVEVLRRAWKIVSDSKIRYAIVARYLRVLDTRSDFIKGIGSALGGDPQFWKDVAVCRTVHRSLTIPASLDGYTRLWMNEE